MRKLVMVVIQICFIFGVIVVAYKKEKLSSDEQIQDEDAIKFNSAEKYPDSIRTDKKIRNKDATINVLLPDSIINRHIIDPPPRPSCEPCYKSDARGKCRKIVDCWL